MYWLRNRYNDDYHFQCRCSLTARNKIQGRLCAVGNSVSLEKNLGKEVNKNEN
jgi:hypothetical protein